MADDDLIRRGDAMYQAGLTTKPAPQGVDAPFLSKNGDLIGHPLEQVLRNEWRKVAKHHGVPHNGVLEADLVRAFLAALAPAQPATGACECIGQYGPNPECGWCGGDGDAPPLAPAQPAPTEWSAAIEAAAKKAQAKCDKRNQYDLGQSCHDAILALRKGGAA